MDNLKKRSIRTDLADESAEMFKKQNGKDADGIEVSKIDKNGISICRMKVKTSEGAKKIGKEKGEYITLHFSDALFDDCNYEKKTARVIADSFLELTGNLSGKTVLAAGLGNRAVTADCIGPKVVEKLFVTRHLHEYMPKEIFGKTGKVCAVSPGVLGITGIETGEILSGICEKVKPDAVVLIDALAAKDINRVAKTVQMCNTGISPGSGVGNRRKAIDEKLLESKVFVVGVPTVVDVYTLMCETAKENEIDFSKTENMIVTPKDIDAQAKRISSLIARALNYAFSPDLSDEELDFFANY